jgi:uncharacterized protein YjdB
MLSVRTCKATALSALALIIACGGDTPGPTPVEPPKPPVVAGVVLTVPSQLIVGHSDQARAEARTAAGVAIPGKTFTWLSTNPTAISISADGAINAVAPGATTISATVDGVSGSVSVTAIDPSLASLTLSASSASLYIGKSVQLTATGKDAANAVIPIRTIEWTSSRPSVATVSATGLVTAVGIGTTTIAASGITTTEASATATITVVPVPVASVQIVPADTILRIDEVKPIGAVALDSAGNALTRPCTFSSSDVNIATLDAFGNAIGHGPGTATITATCEGKSATVTLYVPTLNGFYVTVVGATSQRAVQIYPDFPGSEYRFDQHVASASTLRFGSAVLENATYRIRAVELFAGTALASKLGLTKGVVATVSGPSALATIQLKSYDAIITAPDTVNAGTSFTVNWSFDETLEPFPFNTTGAGPGLHPPHGTQPPIGQLRMDTAPFTDLLGQGYPATSSIDANGVTQFSVTVPAPSTAGTLYYQVTAYAYNTTGPGGTYALAYPLTNALQALKKIVVK